MLPVVASPFYLKFIAAIAKTEDEEKQPFVLSAGDAKTLWKELNKATRVAVKNMRNSSGLQSSRGLIVVEV